ncbi:hypothetical protein [Limisalsivibrio acetivorans]|uniref:hypothetical protein n=1 Tax=Limisalsivibrio acetivorans TaxID=1304888 RepID=UPI0003B308C6|nr:hypothetical protein [Limisalsivibrio acetivorans]
MKRILIPLIILLSLSAHAITFNGEYSTGLEFQSGDENETSWENYLRLDSTELAEPYLDFNFFGRYAVEDDEDRSDIYSAYFHYKGFEDAVSLKLGRFPYFGESLLTLDGFEAEIKTEYYFGATIFAGSPKYYDTDRRHINETFRDTGDRMYGAKLFLNGVKDTNGFISYTKEETDDNDVVQELAGIGLSRHFSLNKGMLLTAGADAEYDTDRNDLYRANFRTALRNPKFGIIYRFSRYNVEEGKDYDRELIITNFSTGKEDRYSLSLRYKLTPNVSLYQTTVHTLIEYPSGEWISGDIIKLGAEANYYKKIGVTSTIEGYSYESKVSDAKGFSFSINWNLTREFRLSFQKEIVQLENWKEEDTVYSLYTEAEYMYKDNMRFNLYAEQNGETRYLPDSRLGVKASIDF